MTHMTAIHFLWMRERGCPAQRTQDRAGNSESGQQTETESRRGSGLLAAPSSPSCEPAGFGRNPWAGVDLSRVPSL